MKNHGSLHDMFGNPARTNSKEADKYRLYELPVIILLAAMNLMVWTLLMRFLT